MSTDTETCGCGHRHEGHVCVRPVIRTDYQSLPEAPPIDLDDPLAWPSNWPLPDAMPKVVARCGCLTHTPDDHRAETPEEAR